jgi:hypothetical protein
MDTARIDKRRLDQMVLAYIVAIAQIGDASPGRPARFSA